MVDMKALHAVLIEMHGGMLTLAAVCILGVVAVKVVHRLRGSKESNSLLYRLEQYAEPTAYLAGIGGILGLVASAIVGSYAWPADTLMNSPLAINKILFSIFATELWILFVIVRSRYGKGLWNQGALATLYVLLGFAGFICMITAGSFGGHMTFGESVLDPVWNLTGINLEVFWIVGFEMIPVLLATAFVAIVIVISVYLRFR